MGPEYAPQAGIGGPPDDERSWVEMHREWIGRSRQQGTLHPVRDVMPKFLGVVISAFINRNIQQPPGEDDTRVYFMQGVAIDLPARNVEHWMNEIWNAAYNMVRTNLRDVNPRLANGYNLGEVHHLALPYAEYSTLNITPILGRVRHYGQLTAIAHHCHKPVPFLEKTDLGTFKPDGTYERRRKVPDGDSAWLQVIAFRRMFDQMAWNILSLIHRDGHAGMPNMPADLGGHPWHLGGPPSSTDIFLTPPQ